ncbi:hypothetical protein B4U80_13734 [Leptotrombidium deliense]|uniref:PHD-type domain-containing protein n=1 Tax=Leptotrombidium deliense TaxID=299467 RepID=A0A443SHD8_9ACAR|nr:hypothetical protein B4U80_13734 [Leptotrombidium deliense]
MESVGGYERHRFKTLLNFHVICVRCRDVSRKAMKLICGEKLHYICQSCVFEEIERSEFQNRLFVCPEDGREISNVRNFVSEDKHLRAMIDEFFIECKQKCNGCTEVLKVKAIEEHESKCIYSDENMAKCGYCNKRFVRDHSTCDALQSLDTKSGLLNRKRRELIVRWRKVEENLQLRTERENESVDSLLELMNVDENNVEKGVCSACIHHLQMYSKHLHKIAKKVEIELVQFEEAMKIEKNEGSVEDDDDEEPYEVCAVCNKWNGSQDEGKIDDWLQCEKCDNWFHTICVRTANKSMSENESFICDQCKNVNEQNEE